MEKPYVDPRIIHHIDGAKLGDNDHVSVLMQVVAASWTPPDGLDINITSRLGSIVSCSMSVAALRVLEQSPDVKTIEWSSPYASR